MQKLARVSRGLTEDERIASDTVRMLKAEERLHNDLGEAAIKNLDAIPAHQEEVDMREQAAQPDLQRLSSADVQQIVRQTVARLKATTSKLVGARNASVPAGGNQTGAGDESIVAPYVRKSKYPAWSPLETSSEGRRGGATRPWRYQERRMRWNRRFRSVKQLRDYIARKRGHLSRHYAQEGRYTSMVGSGSVNQIGHEAPYVRTAEKQDRAYRRAIPAWAKRGPSLLL